MQLTHVRLLAASFDECVRFYRDTMSLVVVWGGEGGGYAEFETGTGVKLALFPRQEQADAVGTGHLPPTAACQDRAMLILHCDDLAATVAALKSRGARFITDIVGHPDWGIVTAYLRDPDGNLIELNSPMPRDQWAEDLSRSEERQEAAS